MLVLLPSLALAQSNGSSQTMPGESRPTAAGGDTSSKGSTKDGGSRGNGSDANGAVTTIDSGSDANATTAPASSGPRANKQQP